MIASIQIVEYLIMACFTVTQNVFLTSDLSGTNTLTTNTEQSTPLNSHYAIFTDQGLFLESPGNFSGAESCFVFGVFAFTIKVSIILKIQ